MSYNRMLSAIINNLVRIRFECYTMIDGGKRSSVYNINNELETYAYATLSKIDKYRLAIDYTKENLGYIERKLAHAVIEAVNNDNLNLQLKDLLVTVCTEDIDKDIRKYLFKKAKKNKVWNKKIKSNKLSFIVINLIKKIKNLMIKIYKIQ